MQNILSKLTDQYYYQLVKEKLQDEFDKSEEDIDKLLIKVQRTGMTLKKYNQYLNNVIEMQYENLDLNSSYQSLRSFYEVMYNHVSEIEKQKSLDTCCYFGDMENVTELVPKFSDCKTPKDVKMCSYALCTSILMKRYQIVWYLLQNVTWFSEDSSMDIPSSDKPWTKIFLHLLILLPATSQEETNEIMKIFLEIIITLLPLSAQRDVILNDTLGYAVVHGKIEMVDHLLNNYPDLDPYGTFDNEDYTFFQVAFLEKNVQSIQWILENYKDALFTFDIESIFYEYNDDTCIPVLGILFKQYPILQKKAHIILKNGIEKNNETLMIYLFDNVPKMKVTPEMILSKFYCLSQKTVEILSTKISNLHEFLRNSDSENLISMTACLYSHNNWELIEYLKIDYPDLLQYHENQLVDLLQVSLVNDAFEASKVLIQDKNLDIEDILYDMLTKWDFYNNYKVTHDFYLYFEKICVYNKHTEIIFSLVSLLENKSSELFRKILYKNPYLLSENMEYFIEIYDIENSDTKHEILTESLIYMFSERLKSLSIFGDNIEKMDRIVRKYNIRLPAKLIDEYIHNCRYMINSSNNIKGDILIQV